MTQGAFNPPAGGFISPLVAASKEKLAVAPKMCKMCGKPKSKCKC